MIYLSPKSIAIHIPVVVAERRICQRPSFYIHVIEFSHVCPDNLIRINENDLRMKENVKYTFWHISKDEQAKRKKKWKSNALYQDLFQRKRKDDVQEQDFVSPNNPLLFFLLMQPCRPLVRDKLVLETIFLSHMRYHILHINKVCNNYQRSKPCWKIVACSLLVPKNKAQKKERLTWIFTTLN